MSDNNKFRYYLELFSYKVNQGKRNSESKIRMQITHIR